MARVIKGRKIVGGQDNLLLTPGGNRILYYELLFLFAVILGG